MKAGNTQFGMRENTASSRQHGSRVAVQSAPAPSAPPSPAVHEGLPASPESSSYESPTRSPNNAAHTAATGGDARYDDHLLTVSEVAELLQVPVSWVYGRTRKRAPDRIPGYRLGKYWRFNERDVLAWVERQRAGAR
jgi:excisionase family DNA binding protein